MALVFSNMAMSALEQSNASAAAVSTYPSTPAEDASLPRRYASDYAAHHAQSRIVPPRVQCIRPLRATTCSLQGQGIAHATQLEALFTHREQLAGSESEPLCIFRSQYYLFGTRLCDEKHQGLISSNQM